MELNDCNFTGTAKFFVDKDSILIAEVRRLNSVDIEEVTDTIYRLVDNAQIFTLWFDEEFNTG